MIVRVWVDEKGFKVLKNSHGIELVLVFCIRAESHQYICVVFCIIDHSQQATHKMLVQKHCVQSFECELSKGN